MTRRRHQKASSSCPLLAGGPRRRRDNRRWASSSGTGMMGRAQRSGWTPAAWWRWVDGCAGWFAFPFHVSICHCLAFGTNTQAHRHATAAEEARRAGRLQESLQEHVEAARCFLEATERLPDVNGVVRFGL